GTTHDGGAYNVGTLYRISLGGSFTLLNSLDLSYGGYPVAPLVQGPDGNFYGTASSGAGSLGTFAGGSVFRMTPAGVVTPLAGFD
ncbi:choice-of-anchor tandem repeat GloVer-containing protein, partial [Acinetobacter baumannii]